MDYPRIYNAAVDMVDRNVAQGRGAKPAFIDPSETLTYGELQARCNRMANLLATYGVPRESRIALLLLDTVDFPVAFWGAIKAGVVPVCLNTLLTTEQYAYILGDSRAQALFVSAPLLPVVQPILGQLPFLKHVFVSGGEPPPFALSLRGELQHPGGRIPGRRHLLRRDGVLALLVGLDRHAQGRAPRALEPHGDGAADRAGLPRHARGRPDLSRPPSCSSPTASATPCRFRCRSAPPPCCCPSGRRRSWCSARSSSTSRPCSSACRRSTRRCWPIRRARPRTARSACACASRPARRCRPRSARPSAPSSASTCSTASAPPRCCTSTCATARAR